LIFFLVQKRGNLSFRRKLFAIQDTPLVDLRAVDEETREAPRDGKVNGEIVVRAPIFPNFFEGCDLS
jgi:hypothetical protein